MTIRVEHIAVRGRSVRLVVHETNRGVLDGAPLRANRDGAIGYQMSGLMPLRDLPDPGLAPRPAWDPRTAWHGYASAEDLRGRRTRRPGSS